MENENLHQIYLKVSEDLHSPTVDLTWLNEKLTHNDFLHLEESIQSCLIANHEQLFNKGFFYALDFFRGTKA